MKAVALREHLTIEHPESLLDLTLDTPEPSDTELLVEVQAVSVNPVDTKVRAPKDSILEAPKVLGWDACGIVLAKGAACELFDIGDRVFYAGDITKPGCNSQYHTVDQRLVGQAPKSLSAAESAAMPLTSITAWEGLFDRLRVDLEADNSDRTILIIGGAGGVGSIAIQLAARVAGLRVITTASKPESIDWCLRQGAELVVNHYKDLPGQLRSLGFTELDYILCCNDTDMHFEAMCDLIRPQGLICAMVDNRKPLDNAKLKSKSAGLVWEFMFTRAMFECDDILEQHHILNEVARLLDEGILSCTMRERLSPIDAANMKTAHAKLESGSMLGKFVLEGWGDSNASIGASSKQ